MALTILRARTSLGTTTDSTASLVSECAAPAEDGRTLSTEVIGILVLVAAPLGLVVVAILWWDKRDMEDRDGGRSPDSPSWWRLALPAVAVGLVAA